ncbi:MAG: STT3 domain-containing protein [Bryobacteraceae bacterium]
MSAPRSIAAWLPKHIPTWVVLAVACAIAFWTRVVVPYDNVFKNGVITYQETDAWFHVRTVENLAHHYPRRMERDPYGSYPGGQAVDTGPFYDLLLGGVIWIAGVGHPSEELVDTMAAWYPAVLGMLLIPAAFLLGRSVFGREVGLLAALIAASLPGIFLSVSRIGYTDHHVMESLLAAVFLWLLARCLDKPGSAGRIVTAGLGLTAYLLTFVAGSFLVGIVVLWAFYEIARSMWSEADNNFPVRSIAAVLLIPLPFLFTVRHMLWMNHTLAALLLGVAGMLLLSGWARICSRLPHPRAWFAGVAAAVAAIALLLTTRFASGWLSEVKLVLARFIPHPGPSAQFVGEMQSLIFSKGYLSLEWAWRQYAGCFALIIVAVLVLLDMAVRRPLAKRDLLGFWGAAIVFMTIGQVRMSYYLGLIAAVLTAYLAVEAMRTPGRIRWISAVVLLGAVFIPNWIQAFQDTNPGGLLTPDWRQALNWLRTSTPEPFGDASFYFADYGDQSSRERRFVFPPTAYSIMAWWDYGYWITTAGRRIPVANPTQKGADAAAAFFLSQSEEEGAAILERWKSRYVFVDSRLVLTGSGRQAVGIYQALFAFDPGARVEDYLFFAVEKDEQGKLSRSVFFRPAYYKSMAVRLFLSGGLPLAATAQPAVVFFAQKSTSRGSYPEVNSIQHYADLSEAIAVAAQCAPNTCILASDDPTRPMEAYQGMKRLKRVFSSTVTRYGLGDGPRGVQIFELKQ